MFDCDNDTTTRLLQLCCGYLFFYALTGILVRYFQFYPAGPHFNSIEYLTYSTVGSVSVATIMVLINKWYQFDSIHLIKVGRYHMPCEFLYIIPAGVFMALIILATVLLYSVRGVSVMVAMVIMQASVILSSRGVDFIQRRQGLYKKKIYIQENMGVIFALLALGVRIFWGVFVTNSQSFNFITHPFVLIVMGIFIVSYAMRIYIMNYFKNTEAKGVKRKSKQYFAIEQIALTVFFILLGIFLFIYTSIVHPQSKLLIEYHQAIVHPHVQYWTAMISGAAFGAVAVFSVFIYMFKGRSATFRGVTVGISTLLSGTVATLFAWKFMNGGFPATPDFLSLAFIVIAIIFMGFAEKRRRVERV